MDQTLFEHWKQRIPDIGKILQNMEEKTTIAVRALPYRQIIPAFFLKNYHIYSVQNVADIDPIRKYARVTSLAEHKPDVAAKVQSTSYLLNNYIFQGFLKSRKKPYRLFLNQTTPPIVETLEKLNIDYIGNDPASFASIETKAGFREVMEELSIENLPFKKIPRSEFFHKTYKELSDTISPSFVIQRADKEVGGIKGTFFVHNDTDWQKTCDTLAEEDAEYDYLQVSPFIDGQSVSMLGCVTPNGVLTSSLQLQLIDVPEVLHGDEPTGHFMGHDWGYDKWSTQAETKAQHITEQIGSYLEKHTFKGIFGVDFLYDPKTTNLYPIECNPRPTGAFPVHSLMVLQDYKVPPLDFFHLISHLNIKSDLDFDAVNEALKVRKPITHISLTPHNLETMPLSLPAGKYVHDTKTDRIEYVDDSIFPWEIQHENEFLMIDAVPRKGGLINPNVPQLFKFIFNHSIASSSSSISQEAGTIIKKIASRLYK